MKSARMICPDRPGTSTRKSLKKDGVSHSRKLFVMANKVCTPFSAASKLFERVSESAHWDRQHLLSIMGYNGAGVTRPRSSELLLVSFSNFLMKSDGCQDKLRPKVGKTQKGARSHRGGAESLQPSARRDQPGL
jgi:hypothetical protein